MPSENPFQISISDSDIKLLQQKLALTTLPSELNDAGWSYGAPLADIKRLMNRWKDGYDWRRYEAELNEQLPQFMQVVDVEGFGTLKIHYVHRKSEAKNAIPLLFLHGWPGSFIEVRKILPLLVQFSPDHPSFHVVAPSLPGFGFSEAPTTKGFGLAQYAEVANKLMLALGYDQYVTQGGDWGYHVRFIPCRFPPQLKKMVLQISRTIAIVYGGEYCKAWHTNYPRSHSSIHLLRNPLAYISHLFTPYTPNEKAHLARTEWFQTLGKGYYEIQKTKPQTLGYLLNDSPVGLLAWIWEKLSQWSDSYPWEDDEVLTWISIYWFSRAGPGTSSRIYYEVTQGGGNTISKHVPSHISIPMGISLFPKEIQVPPRRFLTFSNVVSIEEHSEEEGGGHFAAYERPRLLVSDLRRMFGKSGGAFGVVDGKNGYTRE